ncbi:hypothetical protein [Roseobacter sp. TSBP12]|uniref:hypothetical protein n=1 Tax=Roseobacter sp. TSBP12 TaxID=1236613 RepID=UPI00125F0E9E|nr:hypothetical protein [Roseobacter sp. TSBP12]KAB6717013.1 hypothetical protein C8029_06450 [Roseobacter sp. TSBP12]
MLPPEKIVAQVELNFTGLALFRLKRDREISANEARRLVQVGWGKPDVVQAVTSDGMPMIFECIAITEQGAAMFKEIEEAVSPVAGAWGNRGEINGFLKAALGLSSPDTSRVLTAPRVFSRKIFNITFQEGVDDLYSQSVRGWFPGNIADWPIAQLRLRSYHDAPLADVSLGTQSQKDERHKATQSD